MAQTGDCRHDTVIETPRVQLRPLRGADGEAIHRLWTHPDVRRFLFDDEVIPRARADEELLTSESRCAAGDCGLWGMWARGSETLIGFCGYRPFHEPPELQLLYGLDPTYWGQGLASEAARAMLAHGFVVHGFDPIRASADAPNAASLRVMERAGMRFEKRLTIGGLDTVYYVLSRAEFGP